MRSIFVKTAGMAIAAAGFFLMLALGNNRSSTEQPVPCSDPLTFRIGEMDERFDITENELAEMLADLSRLWSEAAGSTIMKYAADGKIDVNLVYNNEQKITDQEKQFQNKLQNERQAIARMEKEYDRKKNQFESMASLYQKESDELETRIERLNEWVTRTNSGGGFNEETLALFEDKKAEIDATSSELDYRGEQISAEAAELNHYLDMLNSRISDKNRMIEEYNHTFSGERRFTQGAYEWRGNRQWINVFQFTSHRELELVIAHEMGHAIGIGHVQNPESVMHHLMGIRMGTALELSDEDLKALHEVCGAI